MRPGKDEKEVRAESGRHSFGFAVEWSPFDSEVTDEYCIDHVVFRVVVPSDMSHRGIMFHYRFKRPSLFA